MEPAPQVKTTQTQRARPKPQKLSYKVQRELDELPVRIETLERQLSALQQELADPEIYRRGAAVAELQAQISELEAELNQAYARWAVLDDQASGIR